MGRMRSALQIVAFSNSTKFNGIIALLETALEALDETGQFRAAAYVDMALNAYVADSLAADEQGELNRGATG